MIPDQCPRCEKPKMITAWIMSRFNTEMICVECERDERGAPNYARAHGAELAHVQAAVKAGTDTGFPGIGLAPEDRAYLARRRALREAVDVEYETMRQQSVPTDDAPRHWEPNA